MATEKKKKIVVGFWLRLLSDILDAVLLGVFGLLLVLPFRGLFYRLGENGLVVGLVITFLYTGILQSHIGQGQSLAKKLLRIQVVSIDGAYLSLAKSFFRYTVVALVIYNSWIWMALSSAFPFLNNFIIQSVYTYFIIFLLLGMALLIAFHPLKRGLHDLLANSVVVRKGLYSQEKLEILNDRSKAKRAFIIWGSGCALFLIFSTYMIAQYRESLSSVGEMVAIQQKIEAETLFENVTMSHRWHTYTNPEGVETNTTSIDLFPFLTKTKFDDIDLQKRETEKAVLIIVALYSRLPECDYINVQVRTGFNIGITSFYTRQATRFDKKGNVLGSNNPQPAADSQTEL